MKPSEARIFVLTILGSVLILAARASLAEVHATKEFEQGATRPVTIALLPAHVELTKQRMIRREAEVEEAGDLERYLSAAVAAELSARGYRVRMLTAQDINTDAGLQELVVDADRRYGELLTNISTKLSKQVASRRYNAGDEMRLLASKLQVDAIGFVRMQLIAAAKGVQVLNMGMGGTQTMMSVSLIDGRTADIEAYITLPILRRGKMFGGYEDVMKNPDEEMARFAKATLGNLPNADSSVRVEGTDEDVLADLESLLAE
jgi:hypothetical protein